VFSYQLLGHSPPRDRYALSSIHLQSEMRDCRLAPQEFEADGRSVDIHPFVGIELGERDAQIIQPEKKCPGKKKILVRSV